MDDLAACRHADPDLFFDGDRTADAIKVCMGCPVWAECTLANMGEQWGVWGCSERCRRRMRKLRREGVGSSELLAFAHKSNLLHVPELAAVAAVAVTMGNERAVFSG
jgi:hypothetical protein